MKDRTQKIIQTLYLAASDNREKMLESLVLNVLYYYDEKISISDIIELINNEFFLEIQKYELKESLEKLVYNGKILNEKEKFLLASATKKDIYTATLKNKEIATNRFQDFTQWIQEISEKNLSEAEIRKIWEVFNEYLFECFMLDGRKAIESFLPYNEEEDNIYPNLINKALADLDADYLQETFKSLVFTYPEKINKDELDYLHELAARSERFFSLGLSEEQYGRIQEFKLKNLILVLDTNFLFSVLDIRSHPEDEAIKQLISLCQREDIGIRLAYLRKTYQELVYTSKELENTIPRTKFTRNQVIALLNSEYLDSFSKRYYEKILKDSDTPHPIYLVEKAKVILENRKVKPYNYEFKKLNEDEDYFHSKILEFQHFELLLKNVRDRRNLPFRLKSDKKIEHDIFLREAIVHLRSLNEHPEDLKYFSLTLDNRLIDFDRYILGRPDSSVNDIINPHFFLPSIFLRKLSTFMPVQSVDYKKAFLATITASTFDIGNLDNSRLTQKAVEFFKKLGIDDDATILKVIKKELFLKEFKEHEKQNSEEEFLRSEVDLVIAELKKTNLQILKKQVEKEQELITKNEAITSLTEKTEILSSETTELKDSLQKEQAARQKQAKEFQKAQEINEVLQQENKLKEKQLSSITDKLNQLEIELNSERKARKYKAELLEFQTKRWKESQKQYWKGIKNLMVSFLITFIPICATILVNKYVDPIKIFLAQKQIQDIWVYIGVGFLTAVAIIYRSVGIDKEHLKESIKYYFSKISTSKKESFKKENYNKFKEDFDRKLKQPDEQNIY